MSIDLKNYRELDCCANCVRVFKYAAYDEEAEYYCTFRAPKRPLCGSVLMDESWFDKTKKRVGETKSEEYDRSLAKGGRLSDRWYKWSDARSVAAWGLCDDYGKKPAKTQREKKS